MWVNEKGHSLSCTRLYDKEQLPDQSQFGWLIVMGGPMNINDNDNYPWLYDEKQFIKESIVSNKIVLGICFGAQLIANSLGSNIKENIHKEIGWFQIEKTMEFLESPLAKIFPDEALVFHWHRDTFDLPEQSIRIASNKVCSNQGFLYRERVIGLQFHLETTRQSACSLIEHCRQEVTAAPYIQSEQDMLADDKRFKDINIIMDKLLEYMESL